MWSYIAHFVRRGYIENKKMCVWGVSERKVYEYERLIQAYYKNVMQEKCVFWVNLYYRWNKSVNNIV